MQQRGKTGNLALMVCLTSMVVRRLRLASIILSMACLMEACEKQHMPVTAQAYVNEVITQMQNASINRKTINWLSFKQQVMRKAQGARTIADTYPAIQLALSLLGDNHSTYLTPAGVAITANNMKKCVDDQLRYTPVSPKTGYIRIPSFKGNGPAGVAFADSIQAVIEKADTDSTLGWIVDLRNNTGGDLWPMLAAIGPILGEGTAGYFVDPNGNYHAWSYQNGVASQEQKPQTTVSHPYHLRRPNPRVAVLLDKATASAGEGVAISFKHRPDTRFFGTFTCGVSTGNGIIRLSDGALLVLTQVTMADRNKTVYGQSVPPDELFLSSVHVSGRVLYWLLHEPVL